MKYTIEYKLTRKNAKSHTSYGHDVDILSHFITNFRNDYAYITIWFE